MSGCASMERLLCLGSCKVGKCGDSAPIVENSEK
jgi:hypothetical protein